MINVKPGQCPLVVYFTQVHQPLALIKNKEKRKTRFALKVGVVTLIRGTGINMCIRGIVRQTGEQAEGNTVELLQITKLRLILLFNAIYRD